ncbi:hypothetical protein GCM10022393_29130 [Aquimarina addita]|uniref:Uncharacterized protein n=1 Tax=Aquimarina addita TaxID=870485 RepID=A0ABP6UP79_9FLAO
MKFLITIITLVCSYQVALGQTQEEESQDVLQQKISQIRSGLNQSDTNQNTTKHYNAEEWRLIKKQIEVTKSNIILGKEKIHFHKILDTIYLEIPVLASFSQTN